MVEVFKTNVQHPAQAAALLSALRQLTSLIRVTFDLDDCDRVLRVEGASICPQSIMALLNARGFLCQPLD